MRILWIPHTPWRKGTVGRDQHLIRHLRRFGHTVATVSWPLRPEWRDTPFAFMRKSLGREIETGEAGLVLSVRRLPDPSHPFRDQMGCWKINQKLFRRDIRWATRELEVDVIVSGLSYPMTGYPPFGLDVPFVFDYVDLVDWENHPRKPDLPYLRHSEATFGVSELTRRRAERYGGRSYFLPNGADIEWLREAEGHEVRRQYGLEEAKVVSLIGLSVGQGDGTYFVDAVLRAKHEVPTLHCLLVGQSDSLRDFVHSKDPEGDTFTYVGRVEYDEVAKYYAASDIGLYPAPGSIHDDGRSPIKIFEYSAQGTPVVVSPIREVKKLSFDNLILAEPDVQSLADGIVAAARKGSTEVEKVNEYDWSTLAKKAERILRETESEYSQSDRT